MKRRYFLGALGLSFLSFKQLFFKPRVAQNETQQVIHLKPGNTFELPLNPSKDHKFLFAGSKDWLHNPAFIKRNGNLIMGYEMDLTLDTNNDFSLVFDKQNNTWIIS